MKGYNLNKDVPIIFYYEKIGDKSENINVDIPFDLPEDWEFVRLKEIWELISGRDLSPSEYSADGIGIPYIIGASNFSNGLADINQQAEQMFHRLIIEMAEKQGVTEALKAEKPWEWIGLMNNIQACAREIVNSEIIFA